MKTAIAIGLVAGNFAIAFMGVSTMPQALERSVFQLVAIIAVCVIPKIGGGK